MNKIINFSNYTKKRSKGIKNKNFFKLGKYTLLEHNAFFKKLSFVEKSSN